MVDTRARFITTIVYCYRKTNDRDISMPRPAEFVKKTDWSQSLIGGICGIVMALLGIGVVILFYQGVVHGNVSHDAEKHVKAEYDIKGFNLVFNLTALVACIIGFVQIQR